VRYSETEGQITSTLKPCSELLVSVHDTRMLVALIGVAEGLAGAVGAGRVVAVTTEDQAEFPRES